MHLRSLFIILLITLPAAMLAEVEVTARFDPPRIAEGERAQYIIEVRESVSGQLNVERIQSLEIPQLDGLNLRNLRSSSNQQTQIVNGVVERTITQSLIADATAPGLGSYTIPAYTLTYKGEPRQVPAASLEVVERSADAGPTQDELIFLRAELPDTLFVGQTIPLELKLYLSEEVRLSGLNSFDRNATGFTISELPNDFRESVERVDGRRYRVLTWPLTLTPVRSGEQALEFEFGLTARVPDRDRNRDSSRRSPFGGSMLEDFFGRTERLNVATDAHSINVRPLPEAGRPASFSGAIGEFSLEVGADTDQAQQGEPIMHSVVLRGHGNFERINGPSFPQHDHWRHFSPEKKFEPSDSLGLSGNLRFDYIFVPQQSGSLQLPETHFSYFDPVQEEYIELSAPPLPVEVAAPAGSALQPPTSHAPELPGSDLELSRSLTAEEAFLTLDYRPRPARPIGLAVLHSPAFIALNTGTGILILGSAIALSIRKRRRADPTYPIRTAAKQALKQARQAYQQAAQQGDAEAFYRSGQQAVRHAATIKTGHPMQSAESADIAALLSDPAAQDCRAFFAAAYAHRFGRHSPSNLNAAQQQLDNILQAL